MKKFVLFTILSFYLGLSFSQTSEILSRQIIWNTKVPIESDDSNNSKKYYLNFANSIYDDLSNFLPIYYEQILISDEVLQKTDLDVKLENRKYIVFSDSEIEGVDNLEYIKDNLVLDYNVYQSRGQSFLTIYFTPIIKENAKYKKLVSFDIAVKTIKGDKKNAAIKNSFTENSALSSGEWVKIKIPQEGVYKLTFAELQSLGFENPSDVRVFGNNFGMQPFYNDEPRTDDLIENKIYKGPDFILFYAKNQTVWHYDDISKMFLPKNHLYSDAAFYFLTDKNTEWNNIILTENQSSQPENVTVNSYDAYVYYEQDLINLLRSGRRWYGEKFEYNSNLDLSFNFPGLISNSTLKLNISLIARSSTKSTFVLSSSNFNEEIEISAVSGTQHSVYARTATKYFTYPAPNSNSLNLNIQFRGGTASAEGWLDYIVYNSRCNLSYNNQQLIFRDINSVSTGNVTNFNLSNSNAGVIIWDITNSTYPTIISTTFSGSANSFKLQTDSLREFVAFELSNPLTPILTGLGTGSVANQNLHGASGEIDMIILTHPNFLSQAEELAEIHRQNDNLIVNVVTTEQVYNEFSAGLPDVSAIKYYVKMIYDRGGASPLKYLLLIGDGSYKNNGDIIENTSYILTYQSESSLDDSVLSFVSDDYFGLLDDNEGEYEGLLDIGIGRWPIHTTNQAKDAIKKVRSYLNIENMSDSRNNICFIADDEDGRLHMRQAEELSEKIDDLYPVFNVKKVYLDAFVQESSSQGDSYPQATESVNNRIEQGALIIDYIGHGSPDRLTHEAVITINDILSWKNFEQLPLFLTATCEFSRYDDYNQSDVTKDETSAGEFVFLNAGGGAIALLTTTRVVYSGENFELNDNFYNYAFDKSGNEHYAFGDLVRLTKNATGGRNQLNFTLLGDPALKLQYAEYNINTTKINNIDVESELDTLKSLSKVTIEGEVTDLSNNILSDFNGIVFPTVFDKVQTLQTLDNDGEGIFTYSLQNNVLYKGKVSVTNGKFIYSFIVPKDILYNYGFGKLSYYATNYDIDAKGFYTDFIIGGSSDDFYEDETGPEIQLYMNDENFVSGSITNQNPVIYALITDSSGVNTVGNGIGHDITAVIDNNSNDTKVLNEFYEASLDSYQSGKVQYNLYKLDAGEHNVKLKVWDVYNNSSVEEIDLLVVENDELKIDRLYNYPNPFTTHTSFYFEHNMPGIDLDVMIQIFTVSGKLVKTIDYQMYSDGFKSEGIEWDGLDDYGTKIGKGVYIYRVKAKTPGGQVIEKFEKLLILK